MDPSFLDKQVGNGSQEGFLPALGGKPAVALLDSERTGHCYTHPSDIMSQLLHGVPLATSQKPQLVRNAASWLRVDGTQ